ncbi:hypothetical protein ACWGNU_05190 [Paenibacillus lautus]
MRNYYFAGQKNIIPLKVANLAAFFSVQVLGLSQGQEHRPVADQISF